MKIILALASTLLALPLAGQVAYTTPSGYVKSDLVVGFNPIGINLHGQILVSGIIDSESGAEITDAGVDFAAALTDANATYLFEVTDGAQNGSVSVIDSAFAVTANTVTLEGTGVAAGAVSYTIRKAKTLNEVFGVGADATLQGSFDAVDADVVWVPNGAGSYSQYFYSSVNSEFISTGSPFSAPPKPVSFFYPDGALVQVKATAKTITIFGEVKTTGTILSASTGFNLVSVPSPVGETLDELSLQTALTTSFDSNEADVVWIPDGLGDYDQYFVHSSGVWRSTGSPFSGNVGTTPVTGAILIQRKGASTAAFGALPTFFSTL